MRMRRPGGRTSELPHVALRVTVDPLDVAYTTSSPIMSTGPDPWFATSTNSSDALEPPVCTSETTTVEAGHGTVAARATPLLNGMAAAGTLDRHRATTRASATSAARRTRCMRDLPAGTERAAAPGHRTTRRSTGTKPRMHWRSCAAHRAGIDYDARTPPVITAPRRERGARQEDPAGRGP